MRYAALVAAAVVAACTHTDVAVGELKTVVLEPATPNPDLDVLFLIDNSPSMTDKQAALIANFPKMMDALVTPGEGLPNLHIGVATSDLGTSASLDPDPGPDIGSGPGQCGGHGDDGVLQHAAAELGTATFIEDIGLPDGTRMRNYTGALRDVFAKIANVGANGCGFEQHLSAIRRALTNPTNAGFLRDQANLAVIILADEDDCSLSHNAMIDPTRVTLGPLASYRCTHWGVTCDQGGQTPDEMDMVGSKSHCHSQDTSPYVEDVASFVDFLSTFKGDPRRVMVGAVVGDPTPVAIDYATGPIGPELQLVPSCMYPGSTGEEQAQPAIRIAQLVDAFPGRGRVTTVCNDDLTVSLSSIGYSARKLVGDPCIDDPLADTSADPGIQPMCVVTDQGALSAASVRVPACSENASGDCWRVVADAATCANSPDHLRLEVERTAAPAPGSYTSARCLTR